MHNKNSFPSSIPKTISQSIYNYIKDSIINNKFKANQKINEKEIAQLFDVSTTPVREAVLRLGAEGFVTINSHRESVIKEVSYKELKNIFQVLGTLDSLATGLAAGNISPENLKKIEEMTDEMERYCSIDYVEKYMAINLDIHNKIWESVPNKFLQTTLHYVNNHMLRYNYARFHAYRKHGALERSMADHKEILKDLKNKDKTKLENLMLKHWISLLELPTFNDGLKEYLKK